HEGVQQNRIAPSPANRLYAHVARRRANAARARGTRRHVCCSESHAAAATAAGGRGPVFPHQNRAGRVKEAAAPEPGPCARGAERQRAGHSLPGQVHMQPAHRPVPKRAGAEAGRGVCTCQAAVDGRRAQVLCAGAARPRVPARKRHHPPRPQAGEHVADRRLYAENRRLWRIDHCGAQRRQDCRVHRHAGVCGARAVSGRRRSVGRSRRHLVAGRVPVLVCLRNTAIRRPQRVCHYGFDLGERHPVSRPIRRAASGPAYAHARAQPGLAYNHCRDARAPVGHAARWLFATVQGGELPQCCRVDYPGRRQQHCPAHLRYYAGYPCSCQTSPFSQAHQGEARGGAACCREAAAANA
ncbi:hypothetical protein LPJ70_006347, partial [Coemansia sp. RSA 2708]